VEHVDRDVAMAPADADRTKHLFGVRQTSQGVLFVQPGAAGRSIAIAGDFNRWSPQKNVLRYNRDLDIYQTIIPIAPGSYQYRLVVDGRWQADPYNAQQSRNSYGEPNSVLTVEPTEGRT
jgi:1,4-alpha-glucan branching enzyme